MLGMNHLEMEITFVWYGGRDGVQNWEAERLGNTSRNTDALWQLYGNFITLLVTCILRKEFHKWKNGNDDSSLGLSYSILLLSIEIMIAC